MKSIEDIMDEVVRKVNANVIDQIKNECGNIFSVQFMHGLWDEISKRLIDMGKNPQAQKHKFPLIVMFDNYPESGETKNKLITLQMFIFALTDRNYTSDEREAKVFKPVLEPIYQELLYQLARCEYFANASPERISHRKVKNKKFGKEDPYGVPNTIPFEYLDAIMLQNVQLYLARNTC